jgi:DNA-binding response OmpR family regulator
VEQRIEGLVVGADVYLVKPVDMRELGSVIRNLHRRLVVGRAGLPD